MKKNGIKKQDWLIVTGVLIGLCVLAQVFQWAFFDNKGGQGAFALSNQDTLGFGFYNSIVSSFFYGLFFLCLFFLLNFILKERLIGLRLALAVFTAGMLGEILNFLFQGSMRGGAFPLATVEISFSHIYILTGVILTTFFTIKDFSVIFNKSNIRKKLLVDKEQYSFCFYIIMPYFLFVGGFYMFFHVFIQMVLTAAPRIPINTQNHIINTFFSLFSMLSLCFLLTLILFVVYFSNKVYGPVYAFKKYIRDVLIKGEADRPLKLRTGDHFSDLSDLAKDLVKSKRGGASVPSSKKESS